MPQSYFGRCQGQIKEFPHPISIPFDTHGGYNPPCEALSIKSEQKTRQVRRILSLARAMKSSSFDECNQHLQHQWDAIRRAAGYGNRWDHWILGFEPVGFIPAGIPSPSMLDLIARITITDCDMCCNQERYTGKNFLSIRSKLTLRTTLPSVHTP